MARADDEMPDAREDHALDDDDRALIAKLRALPSEGDEPDWRALEAQIRAQVAPLRMPAPWWRNWRWLVPIGALATTAAIVLVLAGRPHATDDTGDLATSTTRHDASVAAEPSRAPDVADDVATAPAMWLDGEAVDLDEISVEALEIDPVLDEPALVLDPTAVPDEAGEYRPIETIGGMLPVSDDRWIDSLDDDAADRLEQFLARKRT